MKLVDIIKSRNGLAYLGQDTSVIREDSNRLLDVLPYDETKDYGDNVLSYKEFVRKFPKELHNKFIEAVENISNQHLKNVLLNKVYEFDGDFIDFVDGEVTYMPYNKVQLITDDGVYINAGRQRISIHKFLTKVFKSFSLFSENQIKVAGDEMIAGFQQYKIEFVEGEKIADYYNSIDCSNWSTTSCMSGRPLHYFKIYTDNPQVCKLGIVKNTDGDIVGRFLHWQVTDGYWINDRFYYKEPVVEEWFKKYCEENNLYFRLDMDEFMHGDEREDLQLRVKLEHPVSDYDEVPYLDTFRYTDRDNYLSNTRGRYSLDDTDGTNNANEGRIWDEHVEEYIDEDDAVYVEYGSFEGYTHRDGCVYIDFGRGSGSYALEDDCMYSSANEGWCLT